MKIQVVIVGNGVGGRGAEAALRATGVSDIRTLDDNREAIRSVFDDVTDTWALSTTGGDVCRARVVIAAHRTGYVPWIPEFTGRKDFPGRSFHAADWDDDFDPAGKSIAVVGTDATAGHYLGRLTESAAAVTVFTHAPRRIVPEIPLPTTRVKRWLRRHTRPAARGEQPQPVVSPIDALTSSGIRTSDGVERHADVIIYGTGFAIPDQTPDDALVGAGGLTLRQAWSDGMEPYFGIAVHGFPNYFFLSGPDIVAQTRFVVECVELMKRTASTRIEVRRSSQQVFNERANLKPAGPHRLARGFDLSTGAADDGNTYAGAATLTIDGTDHPVHVRLAGHLDPIDGNYHWQGIVLEPLPDDAVKQARAVTLTVGGRCSPARIVEQTPWGTHMVAGVGAPPYARE